jgi:1-deoxy-D-xylulose-5-phosphate reductoisomerase
MNKRPQVTSDSFGCRTEVLSGQQAAAEVAALEEVDQVMAAIVGAAGPRRNGG